jgi:cell volume regulation protein A
MIAGLDKAGIIFNLVFFISNTSVLLQGTTLPIMAKWLRVTEQPPTTTGIEAADLVPPNNEIKIVTLNSESMVVGKRIVDLHFPSSTYITLIKRNEKYIQPTGADKLMAGDRLLVISDNEEELREFLDMLSEK